MSNVKRNGNGGGANSNGQRKTTAINGTNRNRNGNGNGGKRTEMQSIQRNNNGLPVAIASENRRAMNNRVLSLKGSDFLGTVTAKAERTTASEAILKSFPVTPSGYPGTRITQISQLYERYRLRKFNFRYVPAVPSTVACQLIFYVDLDPLDDPSSISDLDILLRQAVAQTGSQQWNFYVAKTIGMATRRDDQLYYTGEDKQNLRFSQQGTGYLLQVTDILGIDGTASTADIVAGSIYLDWEVEFQTPQINPEATVLTNRVPYDVGLDGYVDLAGTAIDSAIRVGGFTPGALYAVSIGGGFSPGGLSPGNRFRIVGGINSYNDARRWAAVVGATTSGAYMNATDPEFLTAEPLPGVAMMRAEQDGSIKLYVQKNTTNELFASVRFSSVTAIGKVPTSPIPYTEIVTTRKPLP